MIGTCGKLNGPCPELKRETCDGCKLMETWLAFKQQSDLIKVMKAQADEKGDKYDDNTIEINRDSDDLPCI